MQTKAPAPRQSPLRTEHRINTLNHKTLSSVVSQKEEKHGNGKLGMTAGAFPLTITFSNPLGDFPTPTILSFSCPERLPLPRGGRKGTLNYKNWLPLSLHVAWNQSARRVTKL